MALKKAKKQAIIKQLTDAFGRAKAVVFTSYNGVSANDVNELRRKFRAQDSEYVVAKKTLLDIALRQSNFEGIQARTLAGEVAVAFGYSDEVAPAKILKEFTVTHEQMHVAGGILEGRFIAADQVRALASLPSKQELYARVVGTLQAPVSGFVNVLVGNLRGLVTVLKAIEDQKA
jgi:large subunit ribosomal protein L10